MFDIGIALYSAGLHKDSETPGQLKGIVARGIGRFLSTHPVISDMVVEESLRELAEEEKFENVSRILSQKGITYLVDMSKKSFVRQVFQNSHGTPGGMFLEDLAAKAVFHWGMAPGKLYLEREDVVQPVGRFASHTVVFRSLPAAMDYFGDVLKKQSDNGGYVIRDAPELF